jgi:hypothetical protein
LSAQNEEKEKVALHFQDLLKKTNTFNISENELDMRKGLAHYQSFLDGLLSAEATYLNKDEHVLAVLTTLKKN